MKRLGVALVAGLVGLGGCAEQERAPDEATGTATRAELGPADGHELPGVDLERVGVGMAAPDFTLTSLAGPPVTLSSYRGAKNVVLVFYRGHW